MVACLDWLAACWPPLGVLLGLGFSLFLQFSVPPDDRDLPGDLPEALRRRLTR